VCAGMVQIERWQARIRSQLDGVGVDVEVWVQRAPFSWVRLW
jgi:hypothetical protein